MEKTDILWLIITILAAVIEAGVPALVSIWFVPGGLAALIASMLGAQLWLQIVLFLAVSCLALIVTRPLTKKLQKGEKLSTNADRVIGCAAVVTEAVDNLHAQGRVTVMGNSWSARSADDSLIGVGETVTVERIEGVKLIVSKSRKEG